MKTFFFFSFEGSSRKQPTASQRAIKPSTHPAFSAAALFAAPGTGGTQKSAPQQARAAWLLGGSHAASQQGGEEWVTFYRAVLFGLPFQDSAWSKSQDASRSTGQPAELSDTPRGAQPSARLLQPRVEAPKADPGGSLE